MPEKNVFVGLSRLLSSGLWYCFSETHAHHGGGGGVKTWRGGATVSP